MKLQGWLALIAVSVISSVAMFLLFPKHMPAAQWNHSVDHATAVTLAQKTALDFGVNEFKEENIGSGLNLNDDVQAVYGRRREYYLAVEPNGVGRNYFTPVDVTVRLLDFKTRQKVRTVFNSRGQLLEFSVEEPRNQPKEKEAEAQNLPEKVSEADQQLAETTMKKLWGEPMASSTLADATVTRQGSRFVWKIEDQRMTALAKLLVRDGKIKQATLEHEFTRAFDVEFDARRGHLIRVLSNSQSITLWIPVFLIAVFYFIGIALKRIQHKQALIFLAVVFVLITAYNWLQGVTVGIDEGNQAGGNYWVVKLFSWFFFLVGMAFIAGSLYFVWAAGQSLAIRIPRRPTISLELILKGKLLTRPVARGFAIGILAGSILAVIPLLVAASGVFRGLELDANDLEDYLVSPFPVAALTLHAIQYLGFVLFGFMAPLVQVYVKRPLFAQALICLIVFAGIMGSSIAGLSVAGLLATTLLMSLALTILYFQSDLLAVIVSLGVARALLGMATLLAQPAESLKTSGWQAIVLLVVSTVGALIGVWKFREVTDEEIAIPQQLLETRDERERLKAEFSVAQRAQQQMLPDATPQIPGLEIAAVCIPSKEVGGDLYDFLSLPDGKLGIVVADVSGKGVPASLYMTLTKGLLASVSETTSDPGEILREVNRHLYEVCRRKMFVTLFLGVIDPATKRLTYARAGHNPTVFRRPAVETKLLRAGGIGLGMNSGKIFDQTLKVETVQLAANDKLFFYSDGITEAMNPKNEEYGEERLISLAEQLDSAGANESRDVVLGDVKEFLASNQPQDDQTLVVVRMI